MKNRLVPDPLESLTESSNRSTQEGFFDTIRRLGRTVITPGSPVAASVKSGDGIFIPYGSYGGFKLDVDRCVIRCAPGASFSQQVSVSGTLVLSGASLLCAGNVPAVVVTGTGRLVLQDCQVSKEDNSQLVASDSYIHVETGGFLSINGCVFYGSQTDVGTLVQHDDALNAPRVAVVGSMNLTDVVTTPYVNVGYIQDVP